MERSIRIGNHYLGILEMGKDGYCRRLMRYRKSLWRGGEGGYWTSWDESLLESLQHERFTPSKLPEPDRGGETLRSLVVSEMAF